MKPSSSTTKKGQMERRSFFYARSRLTRGNIMTLVFALCAPEGRESRVRTPPKNGYARSVTPTVYSQVWHCR